jgi:Cu2+-exporting ATPase
MVEDFRRRFWISLAFSIPISLLSPMVQHTVGLTWQPTGALAVLLALSTIVFVYGGKPFLTGLVHEVGAKSPGMMTLIGLAISVAYVYSAGIAVATMLGATSGGETFFFELATLVDIMLLGHWIEMKSVLGASRALETLTHLLPAVAHRLRSGSDIEDVPVAELRAGDRVLVRPGERVPSDGVVADGRTTVDESMLTGESLPVSKEAGDLLIGGSINGEGSVTLEIRKVGADSYLSQVIRLVREAQSSKSRTQSLADRAALALTIVAVSGGVITLVAWLVARGNLPFALERMVTVMVITCPHALGLAIPLVVAVSTTIAARHGLLIRNRSAFESARKIDTVVFDKTGTLTEGRFAVTDVVVSNGLDADAVLSLAAAVEQHSEHPIARGIVRRAEEKRLSVKPARDFRAITGKGAEATVEGKKVKVVSPGYLIEIGGAAAMPNAPNRAVGKTLAYVLLDEVVIGCVILGDVIRPDAKAAIAELRKRNIRCVMITGDSPAAADWVATELGLDDCIAQALPHQKASMVKEMQSQGRTVAVAGDGVNDAPALAQADVGIAIGAGTDVAAETADIILVNSNPRDVYSVIELGRATYRKMVENLVWATGYNVIAIPLAAGVLERYGVVLSPAAGALLMSLSTIIVAINARLLRVSR